MTGDTGAPVGSDRSAPADWNHARLIPTAGIKSELERERRASSCLLAVMHGVPEFGHALLGSLDAPKSPKIETYAEVRFKDPSGKTVIPDGAIMCERGKKKWTCLVEVKTGTNDLKAEQVSTYLDLAREHAFDGVLTISNQITANPSESPVEVDGRKLRKACLWHLSWWGILTEAVVQSRYRGVSDPDQAWILRELIHYLSSEASGAAGFEDMGQNWVAVRSGAHEQTLRQGSTPVADVAERWEQFTQYLCLSLTQELGPRVTPVRPRKQTTRERHDEIAKSLVATGVLSATLRVPGAVGDLVLKADLRSKQTTTSVALDAPQDRRPKARVTWLTRQLEGAPDSIRLEASYPNAKETIAAPLADAQADSDKLLYPPDPKRGTKRFILTQAKPLGQKKGKAQGSFVRETSAQTIAFYRDLVQNLKAWQPPAPRVRTEAAPSVPDTRDDAIDPVWGNQDASDEDGVVDAPGDGADDAPNPEGEAAGPT
jgi:hypothetical protein